MYSRFKINCRNLSPTLKDSYYDMKYSFYSLLLEAIKSRDSNLSEMIHSGKRKRAFLFSNLFPTSNFRYCHFYLTTPYKDVADVFTKALSKNVLLNLGNHLLKSDDSKVQLLITRSEVQMITLNPEKGLSFLSPIVLRDKNGKAINSFDEDTFIKALKGNINRVAKAVLPDLNDDLNFDISLNLTKPMKKKLYSIKGHPIRAWSANSPNDKIIFKGDSRAASVALYYGIGDRTHLGFGMLGLAKEVPSE